MNTTSGITAESTVTAQELADFVSAVSAKHNNLLRIAYPTCELNWSTIETTGKGRKFAKLVTVCPGSRAAFAFVELATGNIFKAAGWDAPAKGIRGNIRKGDASNLWCGTFNGCSGLHVRYNN